MKTNRPAPVSIVAQVEGSGTGIGAPLSAPKLPLMPPPAASPVAPLPAIWLAIAANIGVPAVTVEFANESNDAAPTASGQIEAALDD